MLACQASVREDEVVLMMNGTSVMNTASRRLKFSIMISYGPTFTVRSSALVSTQVALKRIMMQIQATKIFSTASNQFVAQ